MISCSELIEYCLKHQHSVQQNNSGRKKGKERQEKVLPDHITRSQNSSQWAEHLAKPRVNKSGICNTALPVKICPCQCCLNRCWSRIPQSQDIAGQARIAGLSALLYTTVECNLTSQIATLVIQIILWKRPQRQSSPTVNSSPTLPTNPIPWCHNFTVLEHVSRQWIYHLPGQKSSWEMDLNLTVVVEQAQIWSQVWVKHHVP